VEKIRGAQRVIAVDDAGARRGVRIGENLADARAAHPDLRVAEADPPADRRLLEAIADRCDRYTPLVALNPPHGLFLDISGCAHLFADADDENGERRLLSDCLGRLSAQEFAAVGAIASTAGAAWAVARYGAGGIVPAGAEKAALADLPVAALRIEAEEESLLKRLGLKRLGDLFGKPRGPLAARFGIGLVSRLDQALGHEDEALTPRRPAPQLSAERRFVEPVVEEDVLLATLGSLARTLAPALERRGIGARVIEAAFFRIDGAVTRLSLGTASPLRDPQAVAGLYRERLTALGQEWDAGFGFDMVRLAVLEAEGIDPTQIDFTGEQDEGIGFCRLVDRLAARLGAARITRFVPVDTHIPERAMRAESLAATITGNVKGANNLPVEGRLFASGISRDNSAENSAAHISESPPDRPLRLFPRPEPVEVVAEVPEGPPLKFRWRRVLHEVARAEGPERIAAEWWRPEDADSATRDYFRVEDSEGRRYWLFRAGLYGRETAHPVWYVHGLFA
jgi:protein ImuB